MQATSSRMAIMASQKRSSSSRLLLSVGSCIVTVLVQAKSGAVRSLVQLTLEARLSNAVTSVWAYVGKTVWPDPLSTFYPHPAIVTREYGIPGVVGTLDATKRIPDGARVEIDGAAGTVRVLE